MEARESMLGLHGTFLGSLRGSLFIIFFPKKHQRLLKTKYYHHLAQTTHLSLSTHEIKRRNFNGCSFILEHTQSHYGKRYIWVNNSLFLIRINKACWIWICFQNVTEWNFRKISSKTITTNL